MATHRMTKTPEWYAWSAMRKAHKEQVCPEWNSFERFFTDVGLRPSNRYKLLRLDLNGEYNANNCGWRIPEPKDNPAYKHGHSGSRETSEYQCWRAMRNRCSLPSVAMWARYGGRGIKVCERWQNSFVAFLEDMGYKPSRKHTLERIDNDGDYEPANCKWATPAEQSKNRRNNVIVEYNGQTYILAEFARMIGLPDYILRDRICKHKWSVEKAIFTPIRRWAPNK